MQPMLGVNIYHIAKPLYSLQELRVIPCFDLSFYFLDSLPSALAA